MAWIGGVPRNALASRRRCFQALSYTTQLSVPKLETQRPSRVLLLPAGVTRARARQAAALVAAEAAARDGFVAAAGDRDGRRTNEPVCRFAPGFGKQKVQANAFWFAKFLHAGEEHKIAATAASGRKEWPSALLIGGVRSHSDCDDPIPIKQRERRHS